MVVASPYQHVIFDLDGTLVDSASEIQVAAATVAEQAGLPTPSLSYIRRMTGSHPSHFFQDHGASPDQIDTLVLRFREHLRTYAGDPGCVFDSAVDLLQRLASRSIVASLATTKPSELAKLLLKRYGLDFYFSHIQGTDPPLRHKPHPDILKVCLGRFDGLRSIMVGDTIFDVQAANNAGIDSVALSVGTHSEDMLKSEKPTFIAEDLSQLIPILGLS